MPLEVHCRLIEMNTDLENSWGKREGAERGSSQRPPSVLPAYRNRCSTVDELNGSHDNVVFEASHVMDFPSVL